MMPDPERTPTEQPIDNRCETCNKAIPQTESQCRNCRGKMRDVILATAGTMSAATFGVILRFRQPLMKAAVRYGKPMFVNAFKFIR